MRPQIFHRNASVNDVKFRQKDRKIFDVPYDLVLPMTDASTSKIRTDARPFMTTDLLGIPTNVLGTSTTSNLCSTSSFT